MEAAAVPEEASTVLARPSADMVEERLEALLLLPTAVLLLLPSTESFIIMAPPLDEFFPP